MTTWSVSCFLQVIPYVYLKRKLIHTKTSPVPPSYTTSSQTCSCVMWRVFFKQPCLRPGSRWFSPRLVILVSWHFRRENLWQPWSAQPGRFFLSQQQQLPCAAWRWLLCRDHWGALVLWQLAQLLVPRFLFQIVCHLSTYFVFDILWEALMIFDDLWKYSLQKLRSRNMKELQRHLLLKSFEHHQE